VINSFRYQCYVLLRNRTFWIVLISLLLFNGITIIFLIIDEMIFFNQLSVIDIEPLSLSDLLLRAIPLSAVLFIIMVALFATDKYASRAIIYQKISSNSRAKQFFSDACVVAVLSMIISALLLGVMAGSYFVTSAVYGQSIPSVDVLTLKSVRQLFLYMLFTGLFIFALSEIIRNAIASIAVEILWSIGLVELLFSWNIFGRAVMYYPFHLLSELLGNSVYQWAGGASPVYLSLGESTLWLSLYAVIFLVLSYVSYAKRDAIN